MPLHDCPPVGKSNGPGAVGGLEKVMRAVSIATMLMTVPIYLACVGWILLDAAAVIGVIVYS